MNQAQLVERMLALRARGGVSGDGPSVEAIHSWVAAAVASGAVIRAEVERLLLEYGQADRFLSQPILADQNFMASKARLSEDLQRYLREEPILAKENIQQKLKSLQGSGPADREEATGARLHSQ